MPSAVLVHNKCYRCYEFDTLCQFKNGDIRLTEDSITFKDMDWGNTLPLAPTFSKKDWSKSLKKFVKKWNSYADQEIVDGDTICRFPEYFPRFPGGTDSLKAFLLRETQYPDDPFLDVSGTVLVEFIVEKDGSVTSPQVIVSLYPDCDKEAYRVIQSMPKWEPATLNGAPVRCLYEVPVRFWR